jgi:hypothetical protein
VNGWCLWDLYGGGVSEPPGSRAPLSFPTQLPGLSIVLGFNLQHRMDDGARKGVGGLTRNEIRLEGEHVSH